MAYEYKQLLVLISKLYRTQIHILVSNSNDLYCIMISLWHILFIEEKLKILVSSKLLIMPQFWKFELVFVWKNPLLQPANNYLTYTVLKLRSIYMSYTFTEYTWVIRIYKQLMLQINMSHSSWKSPRTYILR